MPSLIYKLMVVALISYPLLIGCGSVNPIPTTDNIPTITKTVNIEEIGKTKVSTVNNMLMVYVPAGSFLMGSAIGLTDEQPVHKVYLAAFWMDRTETTNEMYRKCVEADECSEPSALTFYDDSEYSNHPVEYVSWTDAVNYCAWTGRRLPTEAEWEKAAVWDPYLNQQRIYPWGNVYDCRMGNFDDETELDASLMQDGSINCDGYVHSAPAGSYPNGASAYGILDMGGNVWEWVHDAFIEVDPLDASIQNYYAVSPANNPQGVDPGITAYRSLRGGSYNFTFGFGRSAYRLWYGLDDSYPGVGFRCAMDAE